MTNPYLRKVALVCAAIGSCALFTFSGALAQVGMDLRDRGDGGFVEEQVSARTGDDVSSTPKNREFARANYVWPYATGPSYESQVELSLVPGTPGVVVTPVGAFRIGAGLSFLPGELRKSVGLDPAGSQYYFLLTSGGEEVARGVTSAITRGGGRVVSYDPNSFVMVARVTSDTLGGLQAGTGVVAVEPYHPALKLDPTIGRAPLMDPVRAMSEVYTLDVLLFPGEDAAGVAASLTAMGGAVQEVVAERHFPKVVVEIHRSRLASIAGVEAVMLVQESTPWMLLGEETTTTMQTGGYNQGATPYHDAGIDGGGGGSSYGFCSIATNVGCTTIPIDSCTGGQGVCSTNKAQVLMVVDNGIQIDAGDLSDERAAAGAPGAGHRKVLAYETTNQFGGTGKGDLKGCDLPLNSGRTHGHIVASTALGNATNVDSSYNGPGWVATDQQEEFWALDGVAPRAKLVAYDAQVTPGSGSCDAPNEGLGTTLLPGNLYVSGGTTSDGSLEKAFVTNGARSFNLSFGKTGNTYSDEAIQVDSFLAASAYRAAMVFISAGNKGTDTNPPGGDGKADKLTLQTPATAKNALAIGSSRNADRTDEPSSRAFFSSTGPAANATTVNRTAPQLMAPGDENAGGTLGLASEFACRTSDNDSDDPVECDITSSNEGTSFAAPAAAGAGMLVRDYFGQGFYPAGTRQLAEAVPQISGSLVRAVLVASADFMSGANLDRDERWNWEQGYGRIELDNVLPLETWAGTPSGMSVVDRINGTLVINDIGGTISGTMGTSGADQTATFRVCNDKEPLSVALVWTDPVDGDLPPSGRLVNNLDLKLVGPSLTEYRGNYFIDDANRDGIVNLDQGAGQSGTEEDCPGIGVIGFDELVNPSEWSLPVCENSLIEGTGAGTPALNAFDRANPMEAIFLSPNADGFLEDTDGDGDVDSPTYLSGICSPFATGGAAGDACGTHLDCTGGDGYQTCNRLTGVGDCCEGGDLQTEPGLWTLTVSRGGVVLSQSTDYALVISGGICPQSSVLVDQGVYTCNDEVEIVVKEDTDSLTPAQVASRTTVQVVKPDGTVIDEEDLNSLIAVEFSQDTSNRFVSAKVLISAGTAPDSGNGVLDVNDGDRIVVLYNDSEAGVVRTAGADVNCTVDLTVNSVLNAQYGQDSSVVFFGGCERNVRGKFELAGVGGFGGYPDRYLDADEAIQVDFVFQIDELSELDAVEVGLRCVEIDADSPDECLPNGTNCTTAVCGGPCDPRRENNPSCDGTGPIVGTQYMTILDPVKSVGLMPSLSTLGARFSIQMAGDGVGEPFNGAPQPTPVVELLLEVKDPTSGKSRSGIGVNRIRLNVDADEVFYSTDFPQGGTDVLIADLNENEVAENPIYQVGAGFQGLDYRFETRSFGNLLVGKDAVGNTINRNQNLRSPWNFDGTNGGFTAGLGATTDETLVTAAIYNWGEDENYNNIEDGVCGGDGSVRCFKIGAAGSDARCAHLPGLPLNRACVTIENRAGDGSGFTNFNNNWSTEGGCGWQTKAPASCSVTTTRGCFNNTDCEGACINGSNPAVSTFEGCPNDADCSSVWQCNASSSIPLKLAPCGKCSISNTPCNDQDDSDCPVGEQCNADSTKCGGGTCVSATQTCEGEAGNCTGAAGNGGVWHTGVINVPTVTNATDPGCFGTEASNNCQTYGFISGTGLGYEWWNFLLTPVLQKVNQEEDSITGDPLAQIEITNWAWNHSIDLPDNNVIHTWELDTDLSRLLPVDLTSDAIVLNSGAGQWGPITQGNNAALEDGYGLFAPMGTCGVKNCGGTGTASSGTRCEVIQDCNAGGCSKGVCNVGNCRLCSPASACDDVLCFSDDDCINALGQTGTAATCDGPAPGTNTCVDKAECSSDLSVPGACEGLVGCDCEGVGDACFSTGECNAAFGTDSACTNPNPQGCLHIGTPGTESPCQIDEDCASGICTAPAPANTRCTYDSECEAVASGSVCGNGGAQARAELCQGSSVSRNGDQGPSRVGKNACFFQGPNLISDDARAELGLAEPIDNDQDEDLVTLTCSGDRSKTCAVAADCTFKGTTGPCNVFNDGSGPDEYVTAAGPKRNFDLTDQPWNGPDMRFFTLEDIYGDTGNTFQGALGFVNFQGATGFPAKGGFGHAVDDMVIEWREFTLEPDATDCAAGSCATIISDTDRAFTGQTIVNFRVLDPSPYAFACSTTGLVCYPADPGRAPCGGSCNAAFNDCNGNLQFNNAGDDNDCNNDGKRDVIVTAKTEAEPAGERVVANETSPGSKTFTGSIVVSTLGDSVGVLFGAQIGADNPTVTVLYEDHNDGTGDICENSIVPEQQGFAQDATVLLLDSTCNVGISSFTFADNGDHDDYPDTNETGTVTLSVLNNCGFPLHNCLMRITSNDPDVDCVFNPIIPVSLIDCSGPAPCVLPPQTSVAMPPFQWRVDPTVQATDLNNPPVASFSMTLVCDEIDGLSIPQSFSQALDLDITFNPLDQTTWGEDFEGSAGSDLADGGTQFVAQNNDADINTGSNQSSLINADGWRCQYSDPDWPNASSAGNGAATVCFPTASVAQGDAVFWRIDGNGIGDNLVDDGRAKQGTRSMYYGLYDVPAEATGQPSFTGPVGTIEGAATIDPINLGVVPSPTLSWWHQVSLMDGRRINTLDPLLNADRGVVQLQLADPADNPVGDWIKLVPFKNGYDSQNFSNYFNCMFDPIDDGNDEDDFFDPTDPNRRSGPSSTCQGSLPGGTTDFVWSCIGDTDGLFNTTEVCNGEAGSVAESDRPDWPPNQIDVSGTWLQSKIDLSEFKGRRVRLRFLVATIKEEAENWETQFTFNPNPTDDGWWVDDMQIDSALTNPAVFLLDVKANATLPACGAACTSLTARVTVVSAQPTCDGGGDGSALGQPCGSDAVCVTIAGAGANCQRVINPGTVVLDAPGQVIELNALGFDDTSVADACQSGALQFKFTSNGSTLLRDWTENAVYVAAPTVSTTYNVAVRCSSAPSCADFENVLADVQCPATGDLRRFSEITATGPGAFQWDPLVPATDRNGEIPGTFQVRRGPLANLPNYSAGATLFTNQTGTQFLDGSVPAGNTYYLFARDGSEVGLGCNETPFSWSSGGNAEVDGLGTPGACDAGGDGSAEGEPCDASSDCQAIAGDEAQCIFPTNRDDNPTLPAP